MLRGERRPGEIRNQSGINLSLMSPRDPRGHSARIPSGRSSASLAFILSPAQQHTLTMSRLVACRRLQIGLIRSRLPLQLSSPILTRRAAHSGLLDSIICGDYQRGPVTFKSRPFPSKNTQLWSIVRTRHRHQCRPFWLDPPRKVSFLPLLPPSLIRLPYRKLSKSLSFFPLKDSYGITQLVVHRDSANVEKFAALSDVPPESVVLIQGRVRSRPDHSKRTVCFSSFAPHLLRLSTFSSLPQGSNRLNRSVGPRLHCPQSR